MASRDLGRSPTSPAHDGACMRIFPALCAESPRLVVGKPKQKQNDEQKECLIIGSNKKPLRTWCGEAINVQMMFEAGQNENNYVVAPAR